MTSDFKKETFLEDLYRATANHLDHIGHVMTGEVVSYNIGTREKPVESDTAAFAKMCKEVMNVLPIARRMSFDEDAVKLVRSLGWPDDVRMREEFNHYVDPASLPFQHLWLEGSLPIATPFGKEPGYFGFLVTAKPNKRGFSVITTWANRGGGAPAFLKVNDGTMWWVRFEKKTTRYVKAAGYSVNEDVAERLQGLKEHASSFLVRLLPLLASPNLPNNLRQVPDILKQLSAAKGSNLRTRKNHVPSLPVEPLRLAAGGLDARFLEGIEGKELNDALGFRRAGSGFRRIASVENRRPGPGNGIVTQQTPSP